VGKIVGNVIVVLVAYFLDSAKEWYLLSLMPTALVGEPAVFSQEINFDPRG
jgi:hypothetical protein